MLGGEVGLEGWVGGEEVGACGIVCADLDSDLFAGLCLLFA